MANTTVITAMMPRARGRISMICTAGSSNQTGGMDVSLQIDKMMLYPNGYLNMNQNGEYTKHYYADALRIASKIGSGFSQNLCDEANQIGDDIDPNYLEDRRDKQYDEMIEELTELINGNQIMDINPIPYRSKFMQFIRKRNKTALFFYHPDHLGSTGMVTNNSSISPRNALCTFWRNYMIIALPSMILPCPIMPSTPRN